MRRAARVDANHAELVAAFRKLGCRVLDLSGVGRGCPDVAVQFGGVTMLCEFKTAKGKLTPRQKKAADDGLMYRLVRDVEGAAETVRVLRKWHEFICAAVLK